VTTSPDTTVEKLARLMINLSAAGFDRVAGR